VPEIETISSEQELYTFLRQLNYDEETFIEFRGLTITAARQESHGHIIVGSGRPADDGGGVLPLDFTLKGLINAVRDLTYLSTITIKKPGSPA
jgi:hypothetical protein